LTATGRFEEAIAEQKRALELNPLSLFTSAAVASALLRARRYDEAIAQLRRTLQMDGEYDWAHYLLAKIYVQDGRHQEGIAELEKTESVDTDPGYRALLGSAHALAGRRDEALKILDELEQLSTQRPVSPYAIAKLLTALGEHQEALSQLEKAYEARDGAVIWVNVDPEFDPLRSDPRFQDLLGRMNFPEY
jgi:tetratricopeptide (TPR) repeat protein